MAQITLINEVGKVVGSFSVEPEEPQSESLRRVIDSYRTRLRLAEDLISKRETEVVELKAWLTKERAKQEVLIDQIDRLTNQVNELTVALAPTSVTAVGYVPADRLDRCLKRSEAVRVNPSGRLGSITLYRSSGKGRVPFFVANGWEDAFEPEDDEDDDDV